MKVEFTLTTKDQIEEMFTHMYEINEPNKQHSGESKKASKSNSEQIRKLAKSFAAATPENSLSPAQVQGYLLNHKKEPEAAVEGVQAWAEKMLSSKQ